MWSEQYMNIVREVLDEGVPCNNTYVIPHYNFTYDMRSGKFPLLTARKIYFSASKAEMNWMLSGSSNIRELGRYKHFWEPWADENGNLESSYGRFLVDYPAYAWTCTRDGEALSLDTIDQVQEVCKALIKKPLTRRAAMSLWHPGNAYYSKQPPCHTGFVFNSIDGHFLNMQVTSRSQDLILGLPYDVCNYALLLSAIAQVVGMKPGLLSFAISNLHIYKKHLTQELNDWLTGDYERILHYSEAYLRFMYHKEVANYQQQVQKVVRSAEILLEAPTEVGPKLSFDLVVNNQPLL